VRQAKKFFLFFFCGVREKKGSEIFLGSGFECVIKYAFYWEMLSGMDEEKREKKEKLKVFSMLKFK
jgi:hypothetical protein